MKLNDKVMRRNPLDSYDPEEGTVVDMSHDKSQVLVEWAKSQRRIWLPITDVRAIYTLWYGHSPEIL